MMQTKREKTQIIVIENERDVVTAANTLDYHEQLDAGAVNNLGKQQVSAQTPS